MPKKTGSSIDAEQAAEAAGTALRFLGSYLFQLDEKGRVSLPAAFRRGTAAPRFVLIQAYSPSLALYPASEWAGVEERMTELVRHQPEARLFVLSMMANAVEVTPDGQGRILIPTKLQEAAGLDGQAMLVGAIDKIEIWNPARFEDSVRKEAERFSQFAPQIFR